MTTITVTIEFPALTALVELLSGATQRRVDELAAQVGALEKSLEDANAQLSAAIDNDKGGNEIGSS